MELGKNIKTLREQRGLLHKQVATSVDLFPSNYSKIEKGERQPSVEVIYKLANLFGVTIEQIISLEVDLPTEVTVEDKEAHEQLRMIEKLESEDRKALFRIIDTMLTKKKYHDFFKQQTA